MRTAGKSSTLSSYLDYALFIDQYVKQTWDFITDFALIKFKIRKFSTKGILFGLPTKTVLVLGLKWLDVIIC